MKKITTRFNEGSLEKVKEYSDSFQGLSVLDEDIRELVMYVNDSQLDAILDELHALLDFRYKENIIEVQSLEFVVSSFLERTSDRNRTEERTPVEKLIDQTRGYITIERSKVILTSVAALIAMIGLFMDNDPIIIGAMLLSPMLGPIYAFAINAAIGKIESTLRGIMTLMVLLAAAIGIVFLSTLALKPFIPLPITGQIDLRLHFNSLYVPLGILLGFASMLAMRRNVPEIFAGVAISVALVPPAAVTGIMLAIHPDLAFIPFLIVAQNALGMMVGALLSIIIMRIGPRKYYAKAVARRYIVRLLIIAAILLLITLLADVLVP